MAQKPSGNDIIEMIRREDEEDERITASYKLPKRLNDAFKKRCGERNVRAATVLIKLMRGFLEETKTYNKK